MDKTTATAALTGTTAATINTFRTTDTAHSTNNVALVVTAAQADMILAVVEDEIAASKNRLVSAVLAGSNRAALAEGLAAKADALNNIAAALRRRNL